MAEGYISIRQVLDDLMDHPMLQDLTLERAVKYSVDFMRIVGTPTIFEDKTVIIPIVNYRAQLPCDYYQTIQIRMNDNTRRVFRYTTDSFHTSSKPSESFDLTYKIQNNIIFTSIKEGEIEMAYRAIVTDKDGFPLMPDNSSFTRALELYIKKQCFTKLFDMGKIQGAILNNVQQEYAWAVGDCHSEFNRMSLDEAEAFYNSWNTMLVRSTEHSKGFVNNGSKEYFKVV